MSISPQPDLHQRHLERARILDLAVSAFFMMLGIWVSYVSVTRLQAFTQGQIGPGVLPFLIGVTLVLTSALIALRLRGGAAVEEGTEMPTLGEAGRAASLLALIIVAVLLMPVIGTLVALGLFVFIELMILEKRGLRASLTTALVIPALLYVFFEALLGVPLPTGALGLL